MMRTRFACNLSNVGTRDERTRILFGNMFANMFLFSNKNRTRTRKTFNIENKNRTRTEKISNSKTLFFSLLFANILLLFANKNRTRTKNISNNKNENRTRTKKYAFSLIHALCPVSECWNYSINFLETKTKGPSIFDTKNNYIKWSFQTID